MRAPIVVSSFLIAGALGKPIKRDYVYEDVTIWTTVTVYAARNSATESIPTEVTVSKGVVGTTKTEAAIVIAIPTGKIPSSSAAVHYRNHHKWNAYKLKPFAVSNTSLVLNLTSTSTPAATTADIPTPKLQAFVKNSALLKEVPSISTVAPEEPTSTSQVTTSSNDEASSSSTVGPEELTSTSQVNTSSTDEASSASTVAPEEWTSTLQVTTFSTDEASSALTPAPEESKTTLPVSTPTSESTSEPVNHSAQPTLEDAEIAESDGSPLSDGVHLLTTINKWRKIYNLPLLKWKHQLELNALKTGTDGAGYYQNHELNPGTMAQVITPGMVVKYGGGLGGDTPFELSYVAWLCESSSDPELKSDGKDQCKLVDDNLHMSYSDQGHYDILTHKEYTHIGCAFADNPNSGNDTPYQGLWVCDLS